MVEGRVGEGGGESVSEAGPGREEVDGCYGGNVVMGRRACMLGRSQELVGQAGPGR